MADIPLTPPITGAAIERLLAESGPMTVQEIHAQLTVPGSVFDDDAEDAMIELLDGDEMLLVLPLLDDRYAYLPALLAGRTFTHRLTPTEVEYGLVAVDPDLEPLSMLVDDERWGRLLDGTLVPMVFPFFDEDRLAERGIPVEALGDSPAFLLPPDRLSRLGLRAGDLIGFHIAATGTDLTRVADADVPMSPDVGNRLTALLTLHGDDQPISLEAAVCTACGEDPELFRRPLPPLRDLLSAADLTSDSGYLAPAGFDFDSWRLHKRVSAIRYRHDIGEEQAHAVYLLRALYGQVARLYEVATSSDPSAADIRAVLGPLAAGPAATPSGKPAGAEPTGGQHTVRACLPQLADPDVAEAVLAETLGSDRDGAEALALFAETLEPMAPRAARPALRWLRAKAHERVGNVLDAEATFDAAQGLDPAWPLPLLDLARYAGDRGDAERGLALLRRAGASADDSLAEVLSYFRPQPRTDLPRNAPCWCGSGRKYKTCHRNREALPLAERAAWLYQKAAIYLSEGPWRDAVLALATIRSAHWPAPGALLSALNDPLVADVAMFEGGAFEAFLAERGVLLPDDERLLGEQWLLVDRSVYEVEAVRPGTGFTVRDLRTGDRHEIRERTASQTVQTGMLLCARFVPAGDTTQCFGGMELLDMAERDALIPLLDSSPDPEDLIAALSRRFAPPELRNTEGDPLMLCEATLRVPDAEALCTALDREYERQEFDESPSAPEWLEYVTTHGLQRVRATLRLQDDLLHVETNSEARLDRVLDTLRAIEPALTITEEHRRSIDDVRDLPSPDPSEGGGTGLLDPSDPQVAAALEQVVRQYESAWLDDAIPALAGQTPRQAAADPTRRPDLIRLLDSFSGRTGPGLMDPDRLRAALGLD